MDKLIKKLGIKIKNQSLIEKAFVHKSYINEHNLQRKESNERLEFLGDAVLEIIVTEYLYKKFSSKEEGELTAIRSALVRGKQLAQVASNLGLGTYLKLSKGEEKSHGRSKGYLLANTLEAVIGAVYLDPSGNGYLNAKKIITDHILIHLPTIMEEGLYQDAKSKLQEVVQERLSLTPIYKLISQSGPDHQKKFIMGVYVDSKLIAKGAGHSKQIAEQQAAQKALTNKKLQI